MSPIARFAVVLGAVCIAGGAAAQPVYRCGNEYTRVPCPGGRSVETLDGPSARDRAAAERALVAQRREGASMAAVRERREAARRPLPVNVGPAPAASAVDTLKPPKQAKGKVRVVKPEDFTVRLPPAKPPKVRGQPPAP